MQLVLSMMIEVLLDQVAKVYLLVDTLELIHQRIPIMLLNIMSGPRTQMDIKKQALL